MKRGCFAVIAMRIAHQGEQWREHLSLRGTVSQVDMGGMPRSRLQSVHRYRHREHGIGQRKLHGSADGLIRRVGALEGHVLFEGPCGGARFHRERATGDGKTLHGWGHGGSIMDVDDPLFGQVNDVVDDCLHARLTYRICLKLGEEEEKASRCLAGSQVKVRRMDTAWGQSAHVHGDGERLLRYVPGEINAPTWRTGVTIVGAAFSRLNPETAGR